MSETEFKQASDLIKAGLSYLWTDKEDKNAFKSFTAYVKDQEQESALLTLMIGHGYNPLRATDLDLGTIFFNRHLRRTTEEVLFLREHHGKGKRDAKGGNLYHALARINPWRFGESVEEIVQRQSKMDAEGKDFDWQHKVDWLNEAKTDGSTPLHALWHPDTFLEHASGQFYDEDSTNVAMVKATAAAMDLGADMLAADVEGDTPWSFMLLRDLKAKEGIYADAINEIHAKTEARLLERDTPQAGGRNKPGVRL